MPSLGNDLAAIRKNREISLEEIHRSTKIPTAVLASIEDDSIFAEISSNPTYIRSYVRSYAKALSIEERKIVYALDNVEKNNYSGSLIDAGQRQKLPDEESSPPESEGEIDAEGESAQKKDPGGDKTKSASSVTADPILKSREVHSFDWAGMGQQFKPPKRANSKWRIIILALILIVLGALLVYWFYFRADTSAATTSGTESPAQTSPMADSLRLDAMPPTGEDSARMAAAGDAPPLSGGALPDTLAIVLYAAYGNLEPIRVYTDLMGKINPYWLENGEAIRVNFVNDCQFRGALDHVILLMNGHVISNFQDRFLNPETSRIEITRSSFGDNPAWLQPPPDTLDIDVPPPSVIHQL